MILVGGLAAIGVLDQAPSALGALIATGLFGLAVILAVAPVGRRTVQEWGPIAARFLGRRSLGQTWFRSPAPASGSRQAKPPPSLRELTIAQAPYRDRSIGVISERRGKRLTAVLACRVVSFTLLDPEAQERRLARWGLVLSGAAGTAVRRIQWIERTVPAQGDELARWVAAERDPGIPLRGTPLIDSYLELIDTTARVTQEHEILVAVQVDGTRDPGTRARPRWRRSGLPAAAGRCTARPGRPSPGRGRATRTAFDPSSGSELGVLETADPERDGLPEAEAWPVGCQESWEHYRSDGALHTTYWIGAWPRVEVSPMFMDALLGRSSAVRTVAITLEPIPIDRSTRDAEAAVTRDQADRELRRRFGQSDTARQGQAEEATMRRESELAAGHGEVRFAGFITVTGRDPDDLRRACAEVHEHAARARLELHRMYGQQADAFTFTLPLCRGLR